MHEWISVKNNSPKDGQRVLCFGVLEHQLSPDVYVAHFCKMVNGKEANEFWETEWEYDINNVTHWMPLPKPPKED